MSALQNCDAISSDKVKGRLAVDEARARRQSSNRRRGKWEAPGEIVTVSSEEPHTGSVAPRHDAEAVMLDLVNPIPAGRRLIGTARQAWLDEVAKLTVRVAPWVFERDARCVRRAGR